MFRIFLLRLLMMAGVGVVAYLALLAYSIFGKPTAESRLAALQAEVEPKGGQVFKTVLLGKPMVFLMLDCSVYLLDITAEGIKRDKVVGTGFYFGLDVCLDQSIETEGEYVKVYLSNRAIGAGGGNTSGGTYRSKDGVTWEKNTGREWFPLDRTQP